MFVSVCACVMTRMLSVHLSHPHSAYHYRPFLARQPCARFYVLFTHACVWRNGNPWYPREWRHRSKSMWRRRCGATTMFFLFLLFFIFSVCFYFTFRFRSSLTRSLSLLLILCACFFFFFFSQKNFITDAMRRNRERTPECLIGRWSRFQHPSLACCFFAAAATILVVVVVARNVAKSFPFTVAFHVWKSAPEFSHSFPPSTFIPSRASLFADRLYAFPYSCAFLWSTSPLFRFRNAFRFSICIWKPPELSHADPIETPSWIMCSPKYLNAV